MLRVSWEGGVQRADKSRGGCADAHVVRKHVVRSLGDGRGLRALAAMERVLDGLVDRERGEAEDGGAYRRRQAGADRESRGERPEAR